MALRRETLLDFFNDFASNSAPFLVYDNGLITRTYSYRAVASAARGFAVRLQAEGVKKGQKVLLWSENRPEWIVALWGCLLAGVIVVPLDYRSPLEFVQRVLAIVEGRVVLAGEEVVPDSLEAPVWDLAHLDWEASGEPAAVDLQRDDVAEIIFTSGATAEPKGVVITHRNVLANIVPVEGEVRKYLGKYRRYAGIFFPIRFLNLLPLSHLFGQAMATFIPPLIEGIVVFQRGYDPGEIARQIRERRISLLVCVPKILEVLREHVTRLFPAAATPDPAPRQWYQRWWTYRRVHRVFGWKFWSFIVGGAPLPPALEEHWTRLGYLVIQGYGLTETAPIVTLNHPFHTRRGSVGKPIAGVEVKIAEDGEILVRGENVTRGYFGGQSAEAFEDGWFHTGDIGSVDGEGRLSILGRKKEMIVTPEGLNVFPEDVEQVLNALPGVRESAAVGRDRVHAVLVLAPAIDAQAIVNAANAKLADHQKIRSVSVWPGEQLPRTSGTDKLKRREVQDWVDHGAPATVPQRHASEVESILARYAGDRPLTPGTTLEDLGLSSLDRVELMVALNLDDSQLSAKPTVAELSKASRTADPVVEQALDVPAWNRSGVARAVRWLSLNFWLLPLTRIFAWIHVSGREHLRDLEGPVLFAPNHQSHLDVPVMLAALPQRWRSRLAPAMAKEFFDAHFYPHRHTFMERFTNSLNYYLAALMFNAFPLPQRSAGAKQTLRYIGDLVSSGWSPLVFPEGERTDDGSLLPFQPGIGMMASKLNVPVVPVRILHLEKVLHKTWRMARPGRVEVRFGAPLHLQGEDYAALAREVEAAVDALGSATAAPRV